MERGQEVSGEGELLALPPQPGWKSQIVLLELMIHDGHRVIKTLSCFKEVVVLTPLDYEK